MPAVPVKPAIPDYSPEDWDEFVRKSREHGPWLARSAPRTLILPLLAPLHRAIVQPRLVSRSATTWDGLASQWWILDHDPDLESADALAATMCLGMEAHLIGGLLLRYPAAGWLGLDDAALPLPALARKAKEWWRRERPPLPFAAAVVSAAASAAGGGEDVFMPGRNAGRELAHDLFHYAREHGVSDWPSAFRASREYWSDPVNREALAVDAWAGTWSALDRIVEGDAESAEAAEGLARAMSALTGAKPGRSKAAAAIQRERAERVAAVAAAKEAAAARERALEETIAGLKAELAQARVARSKATERLGQLEAEIEPARREAEQLRSLAAALTRQIERERRARDAGEGRDGARGVGAEDAAEDEGWPADLLAGLRIALVTGQERGGARDAMAEKLRAAGAEVTAAIDGRGRGAPERFAAGTIVVCDVRFLGHSESMRAKVAAERSGAEYVEVRSGEGGIVRAVGVKCGRLPNGG